MMFVVPPVDQVYESAPFAVNVVNAPAQIVVGATVTVGIGLTVTVTVVVLGQPIPVTV